MTQYDETNRGAIWKNDNKTTDGHPDFTGKLNVEGVEYLVSAWKRSPDAKDKAPALKFQITNKADVHSKGVKNASDAIDNSQPPF